MPDTTTPTFTRYGFADAMREADAAIRRDRRPLPSHDLHTDNYRRWAAAVLEAEVRHAVDDAWRCINRSRAALMFDHYDRDREAARFRLKHETLANMALHWLTHLNLHDGDARGPWASRGLMASRERRRKWAALRWEIKQKFAAAMKAYRDAREAYEIETAVVVTTVQPDVRRAA